MYVKQNWISNDYVALPMGRRMKTFSDGKQHTQKIHANKQAIHVIQMRQFSYVLVKQFVDMNTVVTKVFDKTTNGAFII